MYAEMSPLWRPYGNWTTQLIISLELMQESISGDIQSNTSITAGTCSGNCHTHVHHALDRHLPLFGKFNAEIQEEIFQQ